MIFRQATPADLPSILPIYARAREFMRATGNPNQWKTTNPSVQILEQDISLGHLWLMLEAQHIVGAFALIPGEDPTYQQIQGAWLNDASYATIHRIAASGRCRGILPACVAFAQSLGLDLRADTHEDNLIMQHQLEKCGFVRCGIIKLANGEPRIAYQLARD